MGRHRRSVVVALAAMMLAVVALRFAEPVEDGDLFWHMAYGQQMLDRGTLVPDHTLYSWMPASNHSIYCAWVSELLLLGVWKAFGLAGIFGLRYAAILGVLGLLALFARRCGMLGRPETWLAMLVMLLASVTATYPKPELLSVVLWHAMLFCYFAALLGIEEGRNALPWIYAIPALMLVWVNVHGGFILAAPFLAISLAAAWAALPKRETRHMAIAWSLCAVAALATPYGWRYPVELANYALGRTPRPDIAWNNAYQAAFGAGGRFYHLPQLLAWMSLLLLVAIVLAWRAGRDEPGRRRSLLIVAALFLVYVPLDALYVRSTFLLPAIFGYGFVLIARGVRWHTWVPVVAAVLFVAIGVRTVYEARYRPAIGSWMGFGISYFQPVEEAAFLKRGNFGPRIYNTFNAGGYLLWSLYPRYRVMADGRSFPYLSWFPELIRFQRTQDPREFQSFLVRHPGDVAVVDFEEDFTWRSFLKMPGWQPAFYGPSAAVFVPAKAATGPLQAGAGLAHLRNGAAAVKVFDFAVAVTDYRTAWNVLDQMEGPLRRQMDRQALDAAHSYREGHAALRAGDYRRAYERFEHAFRHKIIGAPDYNILLVLQALLKLEATGRMEQAPTLRAGLARLTAPE